jgi:hypothetical protein
LTRPEERKNAPRAAASEVSLGVNRLSCGPRSVKRTIGPAIRYGKSATKVVYSSRFRVGSMRRRKMSIVYDIELNV